MDNGVGAERGDDPRGEHAENETCGVDVAESWDIMHLSDEVRHGDMQVISHPLA